MASMMIVMESQMTKMRMAAFRTTLTLMAMVGGYSRSKCLCGPKEATELPAGDCDEKTRFIQVQRKFAMKDDNCDGRTDEPGAQDCVYYYYDNDGDGFGIDGDHRCMCVER